MPWAGVACTTKSTADFSGARQLPTGRIRGSEKTLEVNACVLRTLVEAADVLRITRYQERASDVIRYVQTWLADPVDGGWSGSQQGDIGYYSATPRRAGRWQLQASIPCSTRPGMGRWSRRMLRAAELLDDSGLGEFAVKSLERLTSSLLPPGAGIAHCLDQGPSVRGLLDDQVAMASASLDVYTATGKCRVPDDGAGAGALRASARCGTSRMAASSIGRFPIRTRPSA